MNEVLNLIREEKSVINEKMKALKKSNEQYRAICQQFMASRNDCGVNTEDLIPSAREMIYVDQSVSCEITTEEEKGEKEEEREPAPTPESTA